MLQELGEKGWTPTLRLGTARSSRRGGHFGAMEAPDFLVAVMCRSSSADCGESIHRSAWKGNS
jgi:hypothetical protein